MGLYYSYRISVFCAVMHLAREEWGWVVDQCFSFFFYGVTSPLCVDYSVEISVKDRHKHNKYLTV